MRLPKFARRSIAAFALAVGSLAILVLAGCSSKPPEPMSADEAILRAETKAQEHKVFYEGWLHPGDN